MKYSLFYLIFLLVVLHSESFSQGEEHNESNVTIAPPSSFFDEHGEVILIRNSVERGRQIFMKNIKKACGMNGIEFSAKHTQEEWEEIKNLCSFEHEAKIICPNLEDMPDKWVDDLYDFTYEYARDSGKIPSCKESSLYKLH